MNIFQTPQELIDFSANLAKGSFSTIQNEDIRHTLTDMVDYNAVFLKAMTDASTAYVTAIKSQFSL